MAGRRKNPFEDFVSRADTKELRDYQNLAHMFPPLEYEEQCRLSRLFREGRDCFVALEEKHLFDTILNSDWSEENIAAHKEEILTALENMPSTVAENGHEYPKDVADKIKKDLATATTGYMVFVLSHNFAKTEERKMLRKIRRGDRALEEFINHNLQLAMSRVGVVMRKNNAIQKVPIEDLIAAANLGLVMGARQFDPDSGNKFSTYAAFHIDGQIYQYADSEDGKCGIKNGSTHEIKQKQMITNIKRQFITRYGREATPSEMQSIAGISTDLLRKYDKMIPVQTQSLHTPVSLGKHSSNDENKSTSLADIIASPDSLEKELDDKELAKTISLLMDSIESLPTLHRDILERKMGIGRFEGENEESSYKLSRIYKLPRKEIDKILEEAQDFLYDELAERGVLIDTALLLEE